MKDNNRVLWVDYLKGLAIMMMVMGHVIAWQFKDFSHVQNIESPYLLFLWRLIYTFHMPLFMFCSGLFFPKTKEWYTVPNIFMALKKRFVTLIVPFFFMGYLASFMDRPLFDYWFLMTLFECSFVFYWVMFFINKLPLSQKHQNIIEAITLVAVSMLLEKIGIALGGLPFSYIFKFNSFYICKYMALGIIFSRFNLYRFVQSGKRKNLLYTFAIIGWIVLFYSSLNGFTFAYSKELCAFFAIIALCIIARNFINYNLRINNIINWLGVHSLEIYLLHFFLMTKIYCIGDFNCYLYDVAGASSVFVVQLFSSIFISIAILTLCYLLIWLLSKSKLLSILCLGRSYDNN